MSDRSSIEWTDATWNPVRGCTKISPGCKHCYAERFAERFRGVPGHPFEQGFDLRLVPEKLREPLRWKSRRRIFVNSMSDLFHDAVPTEYIARVGAVMREAHWHTYQILTKRHERLHQLLSRELRWMADLQNVWFGVSVEDRDHGLPRIALLRRTPAHLRFLSIEPLLESLGTIDLTGIDWVIVGGESGAGARPMRKEWVLEILRQCRFAGIPFFFKQWGGFHKKESGRELEGCIYGELPNVALQNVLAMSDGLPEVGPWARDKLARLRKYLSAYMQIMSKQRWAKCVYVDAFAGAGRATIRAGDEDPLGLLMDLGESFRMDAGVRELLDGSPKVALEVEPPFSQYVFLERNAKRLGDLRALEKEYTNRRNIAVREGDCNKYLVERLANNSRIDWRNWRAVVFLDPFGMQVPWQTIEALAQTRAIEVFLNFPVGMAIQRFLRRDGNFSTRERERLDAYFGGPDWFDVVYPRSKNLFGSAVRKAPDAAERLVGWYCDRLQESFGYASRPYLVRNSRGDHLYFLIFAGPNRIGAKIANQILGSGTKV